MTSAAGRGRTLTVVGLVLWSLAGLGIPHAQEPTPGPEAPDEAALRRAAQLHSLALAEMDEDRCERALQHIDALARILPTNVAPFVNRAVCLFRLGNTDEALAAIDAAGRLAPDNPRLLYARARILAEAGDAPRLQETLDRFARAHPGDPRPFYLAAKAAEGRPARQVEHLRQALRRESENLVLLAELLVAGGAAADAEAVTDALNGIEDRLDGLEGPLGERAAALRSLVEAGRAAELAPAAMVVRNILRPHPLYQVHLPVLAGRGARGLFPQLELEPPLPPSLQGGQDVEIAFAEAPPPPALDARALFGRTQEGEDLFGRGAAGALERLIWREGAWAPGSDGPAVGEALALHDLTGDGITDLATVDAKRQVVLHPGREKGGWGEPLVLGRAEAARVSVLQAVDLDHDGDLDLFAGREGASDLFFENHGIEWAERAAERGLMRAGSQTSAVAVVDFDEDGDLDLLLAQAAAPPRLLLNRRAQTFADDSARASALPPATGAAAFDADGDGRFDVLLWGGAEPGLFRSLERGFERVALPEAALGRWRAAVPGDFDNDGDVDVAFTREAGELVLLRNRRTGWTMEPLRHSVPGGRRLLAGDFDRDGDLDLVASTDTGARAWRNEGGSLNHWVRLVLKGRVEGSGKNNSEGLHARIEARVGDHFQAALGAGGVNHLGLGASRQADVVRVVWPNGVAQTWPLLAADRLLVEEQVLKGSCPFLYTWDGARFRFVTDLMWPSPLGMLMADGTPAHHGSARDWVAIPAGALAPAGDAFVLQVTEELWEAAYVDEMRLVAADAPPGAIPLLDEALRPPPYPKEAPMALARDLLLPMAALTGDGRDVTETLARRDGVRVGDLPLSRYQGLTEGQRLELTFAGVPRSEPLRLVLWGWIFPTDTSINYALAQDPRFSLDPPRLEVLQADGSWRETVSFLGFPKGKEKAVVTDLTGLLPEGRATVRLITNQQIYWDAAALAVGDLRPRLRLHPLRLEEADLHYRGYSALLPRDASSPHLFDYDDVAVGPRFRDLAGRYTRFGPVTPLLDEADDRYVVMNAGDEMTVRFSTRSLPALLPGWSRTWLLYTDGWVKDGDFHTVHSTTVEPLPYHGMTAYPDRPAHRYPHARNRDYLERYQTRGAGDRPFREALRETSPARP